MGAGHDHGTGSHSNERQLWLALGPTASFMVAEVVGGIWTNSLALISDAAHMATDVAGLAIAIAAIRIGRRPADARRTFGYERFEILAAAFNALLLFGVAFYILYEAWRRLQQPPEIQSTAMLWIAVLGLAVNFFSMRMLSAGKDSSLNVKGAYLEVWSDFLGSLVSPARPGSTVSWRSVSAFGFSRGLGPCLRVRPMSCSKVCLRVSIRER